MFGYFYNIMHERVKVEFDIFIWQNNFKKIEQITDQRKPTDQRNFLQYYSANPKFLNTQSFPSPACILLFKWTMETPEQSVESDGS